MKHLLSHFLRENLTGFNENSAVKPFRISLYKKAVFTAFFAGVLLPAKGNTYTQQQAQVQQAQLQLQLLQAEEGLRGDHRQCRDYIPSDIEVEDSGSLGCKGLEEEPQNSLDSFINRRINSTAGLDQCFEPNSTPHGTPLCSEVCETVNTHFSNLWNEIKEQIKSQVNDTVNQGKNACRCCDYPERCLVGNSIVGGVLSVITNPAMSAMITMAGAGAGHRKSCRVLKTMNWAVAGINLFAAMKCRRKGGKCRVNHKQCLEYLGSEGLSNKLDEIDTALQNKYSRNPNLQSSCENLDESIKSAIEYVEEQMKEINDNKNHCEDAVSNAETLQNQSMANTIMGAMAHKCSEDKDNDDEKSCWTNPSHSKYPNCSDKSLQCILNPSAEGCGGVDCNAQPNHASCQNEPPSECRNNPDSSVCRQWCRQNPSHSVCQRLDPNRRNCEPGDEDCSNLALLNEEADNTKTLADNTNNNNGENEKGDPTFTPFSDLPPPKAPPPDSGGGGSSPLSFGGAGSGGGGGSLGGGGGGGGGNSEPPGEGEEEGGEESDPYANLLAGLSSGKVRSGGGPSLTGGSGSRGRNSKSNKDKKRKKFNLKKFLPQKGKKAGRKTASVKPSSRSIFDIHTDTMLKSYCTKNRVKCR